MTETERIVDELRRAHDRGAWHGPSAREGLEGITAPAAASHPIPGAHSIWELVLHLTAWRGEVMRRLQGTEPGLPPEGDWPPVGDTSEAGWAEARRRLEDSHRQLAAAVARFADDQLDQPVGRKPPEPALGNMGQVAILKKVV